MNRRLFYYTADQLQNALTGMREYEKQANAQSGVQPLSFSLDVGYEDGALLAYI